MSVPALNLTSLKDKISSKLGVPKKSPKGPKKSKGKDSRSKSAKSSKDSTSKTDQPSELQSTPAEDVPTELDILRREALELGATEADLALLKDLEEDDNSEQDFSDSGPSDDQSLGNDVTDFMKTIGLDNSHPTVVADDEVPELVEEESSEEDSPDGSASEEEPDLNASIVDGPDMVEEPAEESSDESKEGSEKDSEESEEESDAEEVEPEVQIKEALVNNKKERKRDADKIVNVASVVSEKLLVPSQTDWYNVITTSTNPVEPLDRFARERLFERAKDIVQKENKTYLEEFASNNSQKKFLSQILTDGTLNDKISALTLLIQEAPLHNIKALDTLLGFCEKKSRTASLQSVNALKDLLLNGVLPDRKLVAFEKQPLSAACTDIELATYYYEDHLKKCYFKLVTVLELLSHDPILHVRMNALSHVFDLMREKPEQEANLLRLGINKLGDTENKVASKASYQILKLEQAHPAMKKIVSEAVIDIVFKTNSDYHAKYYSITTLNQTILTRKEEDLANSLVKTYFALFEKILVEGDSFNKDKKEDKVLGESEKGRKKKNFKKGKKGGRSVSAEDKTANEIVEEKNARLFSALLTGLNRAFPFSNLPNEVFQKHLDTLFRITHSTNFNTSIQALGLISHIIFHQNLESDRYYRTLYESLLDPRLVLSSKQGIYLNLLFKSLKKDSVNVPRVLAFVKRILQVCTHWINVGAIAGMLFLLIQLSTSFPQIQDLMVEKASRPDSEEPSKADAEANVSDANAEYDSRKRDPKYANAENSSMWEIAQFLNHYHPTVAIYAESLLEGLQQTKPDLGSFTLAHFLDRFVYKNAKQKPLTKGSSIMQPLGGAHTGSLLVKATNVLGGDVPANTEDWLAMKVDQIKPDEQFFHQYFSTKKSKIRNKNAGAGKDENEDEDDEEAMERDENEIWEALVKSRPDVEDISDEDGFSDFDEEDFSASDDNEEGSDHVTETSVSNQLSEDEGDLDQEGAPESDAEDDSEDLDIFDINEDDELNDSDVELKMLTEGGDEESDSEEDAQTADSKKRANTDEGAKKSKKAKISSLPIFASADDYTQYLDSEDEDYS